MNRLSGILATVTVTVTSLSFVESSNANLDGGDRDSVGLFQQRDSWGSVAERTNPAIATDKFLDTMVRFYPNGSWNNAAIGAVAADAVRIANHLWAGAAARPRSARRTSCGSTPTAR